jgi:hypothetical protein
MEILIGLFRSKCEFITNDNFGGNVFKIFSYSYLLFFRNEVFAFSIKGNKENFEVENVIENIINKNVTLLNGSFIIDNGNNIVCDFEYKPYMDGKLRLIGSKINKNGDLQFNAFSNDAVFWSNKIYYVQNIAKEFKYLMAHGVKTVNLKDGTSIHFDNLDWEG